MSSINHSQRKHALLSASGSNRWLNCTASPLFEEQFMDRTSVYAAEGTLAHEFCDLQMNFRLRRIGLYEYEKQTKKLKENELYSPEMIDYATDYCDYVFSIYTEIEKEDKSTQIFVELRLDFSDYVPEGFGTGDITIVSKDLIVIVDYKYGKGVKVSAHDNSQLKLYALGAYNIAQIYATPTRIKMCIYQPRIPNVSESDMKIVDLVDWAENYVAPRAKVAFEGGGTYKPGEWCRFCKGKNRCKKLAEYNLEVAKYEFKKPNTLSDEELIDIFKRSKMFSTWIDSVTKYMFEQAKSGKKFDGLKLVHGISRTRWRDEEAALEVLKSFGYTDNEITDVKIKAISKIKNKMSVDDWEKCLDQHTVKPLGKPTLVSEDDPRTEIGIQDAIDDFS